MNILNKILKMIFSSKGDEKYVGSIIKFDRHYLVKDHNLVKDTRVPQRQTLSVDILPGEEVVVLEVVISRCKTLFIVELLENDTYVGNRNIVNNNRSRNAKLCLSGSIFAIPKDFALQTISRQLENDEESRLEREEIDFWNKTKDRLIKKYGKG